MMENCGRLFRGSGVMRPARRRSAAVSFKKAASADSSLDAVERAYDLGYQAGRRDAEREMGR